MDRPTQNSTPPTDDDSGRNGRDLEETVRNKPVPGPDITDDLNDSADSFVSPARTDGTPN